MAEALDWTGPAVVDGDRRPLHAATLFHLQWDDELFPRGGQLALFDVLGSRDKQLIGFTGPHAETRPAAVALWREFVARHLARGDEAASVKATVRSG